MLFDIKPHIKKEITGIIQVGAHHGNEYNSLKDICENILMFEPQTKVYEQLCENMKNNKNVVIEKYALGSVCEKKEMFLETANSGQSSSLLKPQLHTVQYPGIIFHSTETVEVITLNEYFKDKKYNFNLITLDVQGFELEVLKGASDILDNVDYILCEVNRAELYQNCAQVDEITNFLQKYGFIQEFVSWDGYTWGDALYKKCILGNMLSK